MEKTRSRWLGARLPSKEASLCNSTTYLASLSSQPQPCPQLPRWKWMPRRQLRIFDVAAGTVGTTFLKKKRKRKKVISTQVRMKIQLCDEASTLPEASGALEFRKIVLIIASGILSFPPTAIESNKSYGHWQYSTTHRIRFHSYLLCMPLG